MVQYLKDLDGNLTRIEKEKEKRVAKFYRRDPSGRKIEVPTDSKGKPRGLMTGGDRAPVKGEYMVYPGFLRDYK